MRRLLVREATASLALRRAAMVVAACAMGCADWARPPLMAGYDAQAPLVQEQAPVGFDATGNAAALQLVDAEGRPPELELVVFDRGGGPTRLLERAPADVAAAVAAQVRARGAEPALLLADVASRLWPAGIASASARGYTQRDPRTGSAPWSLGRALSLHAVFDGDRAPPSFSLVLASDDPGLGDIELARQPVSGTRVEPRVWIAGAVAWLLSGSIAGRDPLRRMVALRRGSLSRGEAALHDLAGRRERLAGNLATARIEFERAIAADPGWFDALYDGAAAAAAAGQLDDALSLLRRAAQADPRRVQVVGRDDDDLRELRRRGDVRALLGIKRPPAE